MHSEVLLREGTPHLALDMWQVLLPLSSLRRGKNTSAVRAQSPLEGQFLGLSESSLILLLLSYDFYI